MANKRTKKKTGKKKKRTKRTLKIITSPLNNAIAKGDITKVKELLTKGADSNEFTNVWCTSKVQPFIRDAELFICKVNSSYNDIGTPIQVALTLRKRAISNVLLDHGVDVTKQYRKTYKSTLQMAIPCGLDLVKKVYEKGCTDVNHVDFNGNTALGAAVWFKHAPQKDSRVEVVQFLLDKGANVNHINKYNGASPLEIACRVGHIDVITLLIRKGANVNNRNKRLRTPLHEAILSTKNTNCNKEKIVRLLVKHGANVNTHSKDTHSTPLSSATAYGLVNVVATLLKLGAKKKTMDTDKMTPLANATWYGYDSIIKLLQ
jgi:ankyrin repeat protein